MKKIFIFIIMALIAVGLVAAWFLILAPQCPISCDDRNSCTQDSCSKETRHKCVNEIIPDCCGNKICEIEEKYEICPADCPNCDDNNECTKDSFDYHLQKCANLPILTKVCCGNTACEIGETYQNCSRDCPNCDDENKCTKDSYDYYEKKCTNKVIIPCCGNGICDKGAETYANCLTDCPKCDDNSKLTADTFNYTTQKCEYVVTHYFIDDFEEGAKNWSYNPTPEDPTAAWEIKTEGNNTVFRGTGHNWAELIGKEWTDYIFKVKFKIVKGQIHFNYRLKQEGGHSTRYFIGLGSGHLNINKQIGENFFSDLVRADNFNPSSGWHTIEIRGYGSTINILVDGTLLIKYKDSQNPLLSGGVGLETHDDSEFLIDDVEIKVIKASDVIYP